MKSLKLMVGAAALFAAAQVGAMPIVGTFVLVPDIDPISGVPSGPTLTGEFTTKDVSVAGNVQTSAVTGVTFVDIDIFDIVVPPAPGQALTVADFSNGPFAILAGPLSTTVVGLSGNAARTVGGINYFLDLTVDENNVAQGTFTSSGGHTTGISFSGNQAVPEPGALALFGIGLAAFGAFKRRQS